MDKDEISRRILNFSLEIIYLLSGEAYTLVQKTSDDPEAPSSHLQESGGWSWSPSAKLPPHPQIHEQRILELTMKMTALLSGEVPIRCQDVAVYFSMEEREYIEGHKDLYQDVMMEDPRPRTVRDCPTPRKPPKRPHSPLHSQECVKGVQIATMPPKQKVNSSTGDTAKKRKTITMENKVEIIKRSERGETPSSIGRALGYSRSTIGTILKDKGRIMEHVKGHTPMNATIITKHRSGLIIEMERLLIIWIEDQNHRNIPISPSLVQEKARSLFNILKAAHTEGEGDYNEDFVASKGWFNRFKKRANLHNIKVHSEAANISASSHYPKTLEDIIIDNGEYLPKHIFDVNETGLFWEKMSEDIDFQ
ncbi:putative CENPB DNA-binding domain-containing protein 1 isoform X2 [Engystomops pustulosus]